MSKTFKSAAEGSTRTATVSPVRANGGRFRIELDGGSSIRGILLSASDAPALALAILEAAQGDNDACDANVHEATVALRTYLVIREAAAKEAAAKEAADREVLDREALELYNRVMRSGKDPLSEWLPTLQFTRIKYTNIAKAARELHGATK